MSNIYLILLGCALLGLVGCHGGPDEAIVAPAEEPPRARILAVSAVDHNEVYAVGDSVWWSPDGGQNWYRDAVPQPLVTVEAFPNDQAWACAESGRVYCTANHGKTWLDRTPAVTAEQPDAKSMSFFDARHGWVAGRQWFAYTNDGGDSWQIWPAPDSTRIISDVCALSETEAWIVNTVAYHTTDAGLTWTSYDPGFIPDTLWVSRWYSGVKFFSPTSGWLIRTLVGPLGASSTAIFATQDGGVTWTCHYLPYNMGFHDLDRTGESSGWGLWYLHLYQTTNDGSDWSTLDLPCPLHGFPDHSCGPFFYDLTFVDDNCGWVAAQAYSVDTGDQWFVLHTANAGESWIAQSP